MILLMSSFEKAASLEEAPRWRKYCMKALAFLNVNENVLVLMQYVFGGPFNTEVQFFAAA